MKPLGQGCIIKFLISGDDDIFLNPEKLQNLLLSIPENSVAMYGSRLVHSPRIKNPRSKYYVSSNLWNEDYYPKYVSGGGFVMTKNAALGIFKGNF